MDVLLHQLAEPPNRIAITKIGAFVDDGTFYLDFSRPLKRIRGPGLLANWIGRTLGLFVPVIHQSESSGGYMVSVERSDPHFNNLQVLWRQQYLEKNMPPEVKADNLKIVADFARQFPEDSQSV